VLLLDEPLSNLDAHLRDEMRELILRVQREFEITTVMVTHDQQDALLLADRIGLMFEGVVHQVGRPTDFYRRPVSERVARFFGGVNFMPARWTGEVAETPMASFRLDLPENVDVPPGPAILTIRPEHIELGVDEGPNTCTGLVRECIYVGTHTRCKITVDGHEIEASSPTDSPVARGGDREVTIRFPPDRLWLLPDEGD